MDTDLELCTFYSAFFRESLKLNKHRNLRKFKRFLKAERKIESADSDTKERAILEEDFYREKFAFLFENNVFTSSAVAALFQGLLDKNGKLLVRLMERDVISICCFSDGTCSEIVAIILVLDNALQNITNNFRFNLTVICSDRNWKNFSLKILKSLEHFKLSRENVKFIGIDVSEELPEEAQQVIRNADIVTMVKFLSKIHRCRRRFSAVLKDIFQHLKPESIIFFLDCAYTNFFYGINRQLSSCLMLYHKSMYLHMLNLETVKNNFKPFHNAFEDYFFIKLQKICFAFWINVDRSTSRTDIFNVLKVDNVPLKKEKSLSKKTVNNTSLHYNSIKSNFAASSVKESSSTKNYIFSGKSNRSSEPITDTWSRSSEPRTDTWTRVSKLKTHTWTKVSKPITDTWSRSSEPTTDTWSRSSEPKTDTCTTLSESITDTWTKNSEPITDYWTNTKPLSKFAEGNYHEEKGITKKKMTQKSQKDEANNIDPSTRDSFRFTKQLLVKKLQKKEGRNGKSRKEQAPDELITTNDTKQKCLDTLQLLNFEEKGNKCDGKMHHVTTLKSSKVQKMDIVESEESSKRHDKAINIRLLQDQRNRDSNVWNTETNTIQWEEFEEGKINNKEMLQNISIPKPGSLSKNSENIFPPQIEANLKKKKGKNVKRRNQPVTDKMASNEARQNYQNTYMLVSQKNKGNSEDYEICSLAAPKFLELQNMDIDETKESSKRKENWSLFSKNNLFPQTQRNRDNNSWDTDTNKIEWAEFGATAINSKQNVHSITDPKSKTLSEKNKKHHVEINLQKKKRRKYNFRNQLTPVESVSNAVKQKHQRTPERVSQDSKESKEDCRSCHQATLKPPDLQNMDTDESEESLKRQKSLALFCKNIQFPQTGRNRGNNSWNTETRKIEWAECEAIANNIEESLNYFPILKTEELNEKSENILSHKAEVDTQKKKRKKQQKRRKKPALVKTVSTDAEQNYQNTSKWVSKEARENVVDSKSCYPTALEPLKSENIDASENEKSLKISDKISLFCENIQFPQTQRNKDYNIRSTETTKMEWTECEETAINTREMCQDVSVPKIEALCERNNEILTHQTPSNPQRKKLKKQKRRKPPALEETVFSIEEQKHQDNLWLPSQQDIRNDYIKNNLSKTLKSIKVQKIDKNGSEELLKSHVNTVLFDKNIEFRHNQTYYNTWDTMKNKKECEGHELTVYNSEKTLHSNFPRKSEALFEKNQNMLTQQVEFDHLVSPDQFLEMSNGTYSSQPNVIVKKIDGNDVMQIAAESKPTKKYCGFIEKKESFYKMTNNEKSPGNNDVKQARKSETNEIHQSFSNLSNQKLTEHETSKVTNTTSLVSKKREWYPSQKAIWEAKKFKILNNGTKLLSFTCSYQKSAKNETCTEKSNHVSLTALTLAPDSHFIPENVMDKTQVENFETDTMPAVMNNLNQKCLKEEICYHLSVISPASKLEPHPLSQNQKFSEIKIAPESQMENRKKAVINKEDIVTSKSARETCDVRGKQITDNVYLEQKEKSIQATIPEKAFYSLNILCVEGEGFIKKQGDEKVRKICSTNKSRKSSKWGFSHKDQDWVEQRVIIEHKETLKEETEKKLNEEVGKEFKEAVSGVNTGSTFTAREFLHFSEEDMKFVEQKPKKISLLEKEEAKNKLQQSKDEFSTLPQLLQKKKKKKGSGKAKKKKKTSKKKKKVSDAEVVDWDKSIKFECINENFSLITLAADYANTLLTKINLINREDIAENRTFTKKEKIRKKRFSESTHQILLNYFMHDDSDDDLDWFFPAFNQSSPKNQRWDFWWKKWNWV